MGCSFLSVLLRAMKPSERKDCMSNYGKGNPHNKRGVSTLSKKVKGWKWAGIMPLPRKGSK